MHLSITQKNAHLDPITNVTGPARVLFHYWPFCFVIYPSSSITASGEILLM